MSATSSPWATVSLQEICNPKQWPTIPQKDFVQEGYPVYGANGKIGFYTLFNHEKPTVLITCRGATCGTINVCEPKSYVTGNAMALDDLAEKRVSREYLVYALRHVGLAKAITGTAQPQITRQSLTAVSIPLPSLAEQRLIAATLNKAEAIWANRQVLITQLDTLTQAIFLELFGNPIQNRHGFPVSPLIDLVDPQRPITYGILMPGPDQNEGVKYVRVVDMQEGSVELSGIRKTTEAISNAYRRSVLQRGDLLMSIRGHVGRFAIVPPELEGANITQDTARLAMRAASPIFVRECLRTEAFQHWMARHTKGVAVRGINLSDVKRMPIILPSRKDQDDFGRRTTAIDNLRAVYRASLTEMNSLFASLQHRAFRGEL
jgi:type I restriction enzyme S subunit